MKKLSATCTVCFCLLAVSGLFAGNSRDFEKKFDRAEVLYKGGNFSNALPMYLELYRSDSTNFNICYKLGACYLRTGKSYDKAVHFLEKAVGGAAADFMDETVKERRAPLNSHKLLGDAYHMNYRFDDAIASYEKYRQLLQSNRVHNRELVKEIARKIEMCKTGRELMAHPAEVKIVNLGTSINSSHPDYSPRLSADQSTMIFTSRRPENTGGKTYDGGQYFEDIYIATRRGDQWGKAQNIGWPINTVGNEAAIGISADGQEILIYKDDMGDGNIYSSRLEGDKWSQPKKLNSYINSPYWEPSAFLSADGLSLFFVSDRPGGHGGTDIYRSRRAPGGDWGRPVNLGPAVNSPYDEHSPYIHPDGATLFYSSKGHNTMGGYDVFFTRATQNDDRTWAKPTNVGYPINTPGDDAFYMVSTDKQTAYYSSMMKDAVGDKDIYLVTFSESISSPLALLKGKVYSTGTETASNVVITVTDNETNEVEGVYYANPKTGEYLFVLTPGRSHNISYEADGRLFYSENRFVPETGKYTEIVQDIRLSDLSVGAKVSLSNIFFDFDDTKLRPSSKTELDRLVSFMKKNPNIGVEVTGFADAKGADDYNRKLSLGRAQSVVNYITGQGVEKSRLTATGLGAQTHVVVKSGKDPAGRESDRRVELKIVRTQ
jgi:outer membrane protein OmpA-like peptidoglycan-associated protein